MRILLTGATGFIGKNLVINLTSKDFDIFALLRKNDKNLPKNIKQIVIGDFTQTIDFSPYLQGIDCIIHLAGKAHVIDKNKASVLDEFRKVNTEFSVNLANSAAKCGVKRFIFLSSIRVNGNQNVDVNKAFLETDAPNPQEPYAISKFEAEQELFKITKNSNMEMVIIRPPLVYGINAPGNFGRLIHWASKKYPIPLPFGLIKNSRSLVAIDNLVDFIILCTKHKKASNEIFLISDGEDLSTTQLLKKLTNAFDKKVVLLPVPTGLMIFIAGLIGKKADATRLFSSLQVDISKVQKLLNWNAVVTMDEQLNKIANEKSV
jgi:nucleoside-diphosphate-sugar epimerase